MDVYVIQRMVGNLVEPARTARVCAASCVGKAFSVRGAYLPRFASTRYQMGGRWVMPSCPSATTVDDTVTLSKVSITKEGRPLNRRGFQMTFWLTHRELCGLAIGRCYDGSSPGVGLVRSVKRGRVTNLEVM